MGFLFKIIPPDEITSVIPLIQKLTGNKFPDDVLEARFSQMVKENYECVGIYAGKELIGCSGMWFCTRHYAGKSCEPDHVFIDEKYRSQGLGKKLFSWIYQYALSKGCEASELNTYVHNYPSHKFYYNEGYQILGYHFFKKL